MKYKIAVFPGDGVGPELVSEGVKVIEKAAELDKFEVEFVRYPYGAEHYAETLELLDEKTLKEIKSSCNAVYCGTFENVNGQRVPSIIRNYFGHFASLMPVRLLQNAGNADFLLVRETTEEFFAKSCGKARNGKNREQIEVSSNAFKAKFGMSIDIKGSEIAYQIGMLSRKGCERIARYAFELAKRKNKKKVTAIDKSNMLEFHGLWKESFEKISKEYQEISLELELADSAAMNFIRQPEKYEIVAATNLLGDILGDLATAVQGLSFACRASIGQEISMFEPAHGSAPKLKGKGIVNPIATIWAASLMLDSVGEQKSSLLIEKSIERVLKEEKTRTQDLNGNNTTSEMADAIIDKFIEIHD
ncbi:isocitrate/isopropylmalate dehydrogenase family protein [Candidatus Woesearchaeota archaeon]|nr:isocitrate/isopropylmalate dehydrogenase family protein [Candidatus Woesearchaeota archaeon]